jgi:glycosyltransferase involved in cell wall biosynthesis
MPELVVLAEQLLAPVPGGTGRYTEELLAALAASAPEGWRVSSVTSRQLRLPRKGLTLLWERGVPLWPGGDSVHAPTPFAPPRARRGRRLVVTVHDTVPFTHPETLTPRGVAWHRRMIRRATRAASAIVVPTHAVAGGLRRHAPGPAPIHVIGHGVPDSLLRKPSDPDRIAAELRLPDAYVLAVGTVEPRKGLDVLLAAMARPGAPDLPVVIAGPRGWGEVDLTASGVPVHVLGRITDEQLGVVLRRASVLAVPSRAEGFGLPLLEAMALGVPVVHSDAPALVEVAGGTGVCVPRGEAGALAVALREVAGAPAPAAARTRAMGFTWTAAADAVWKVHLGCAL